MKKENRIILNKEQSEGFLKFMSESKLKAKEKIRKMFPPKEIIDFMNTKTEETNKLNGGTLDTSTFMLGMMAMWSHMDKLNKQKNNEDNSTRS